MCDVVFLQNHTQIDNVLVGSLVSSFRYFGHYKLRAAVACWSFDLVWALRQCGVESVEEISQEDC